MTTEACEALARGAEEILVCVDRATPELTPTILQVATVVILALTLWLTARLASSTRQQALATRSQVELMSTVSARPMVSVRRLTLSWENATLKSIAFSIANAGQGSAFNASINVAGIASTWKLRWDLEGGDAAHGALPTNGERSYFASPSGGSVEDFDNQLVISTECFDVLLTHYRFVHTFVIRPGLKYAKEVGLAVELG